MFLNELAERRVVVIFCGRFQPFHRGHAIVYNNLVSTYGRNNVYIGTSGKVEPPTSPFTLSDRIYFMNLMGIPSDRIVQLSNNYNPVVAAQALGIEDLSNTVMIFPVSQKDVDEKPSLFAGGTKKDGTPAKLQPLPKDQRQIESADKHAYIQIVNVEPFNILGQSITGATSIRDLYSKADPAQRQQIIKDLYGKYTHEAEKIMNDNLLPSVAVAPAPLKKKTELQKVKVPKAEPIAEAQDPQAVHDQGLEIPIASKYAGDGQFKITVKNKPYIVTVAGFEIDDLSPGNLDSFYLTDVATGRTEHVVSAVNNPLAVAIYNNLKTNQLPALKQIYKQDMELGRRTDWQERPERLQGLPLSGYNAIPADRFIKAHRDVKKVTGQGLDECGGTGVVATKKQAKDPRYSTSLTKDVRPGAIKKSLRAFNLAEEDIAWAQSRLSESEVDNLILTHIKYINQDIDAIKERIATEKLPSDYVQKLKQKIVDLEQQRSKLMFDPK